MTDPILEQAERHRADDAAIRETLELARRFAEVLAADEDPSRREVAGELIAIVGVPL